MRRAERQEAVHRLHMAPLGVRIFLARPLAGGRLAVQSGRHVARAVFLVVAALAIGLAIRNWGPELHTSMVEDEPKPVGEAGDVDPITGSDQLEAGSSTDELREVNAPANRGPANTRTMAVSVLGIDGNRIPSKVLAYRASSASIEAMRLVSDFSERQSSVALEVQDAGEGIHSVSLPTAGDPIGIVVSAPMHLTQVLLIKPAEYLLGVYSVSLTPCSTMTVRVVDSAQQPIANARVITRGSDLGLSLSAQDSEVLPSVLFQLEGTTDSNGEVMIGSPLDEPMSITVFPPGRLATVTIWDVVAQPLQLIVCKPSFIVSGSIIASKKSDLLASYVTILRDNGQQEELPLATGQCDEGGRYAFEGLPADGSTYYVLLHGDLIVPQASPRFTGAEDLHYVYDFTLIPGVSSKIELVTKWGAPLQGVALMLRDARGMRFPYTLTTDASGIVEFPAMMRQEDEYRISALVSNYWTECASFRVLPTEQINRVVVDGIAELSGIQIVPAISEEYSLALFPKSERFAYSATVDEFSLPALVPSGPLDVVLLLGSGRSELFHAAIGAEANQSLRLVRSLAPLRFTLPESEDFAYELSHCRNVVAFRQERASGEQTVQIPPGQYYFTIYRHGSASIDIGPFAHSASGTNLGEIDIGSPASITGRVLRDSGAAMSGVAIRALGHSGYRSPTVMTDEQGQYHIEGLPAGEYEVYCAASGLGAGRLADQGRTVFVDSGAVIANCNFTIPGGATAEVRIYNPIGVVRGGFLASGDGHEYANPIFDNTFSSALFDQPLRVGFWGEANGDTWVVVKHCTSLDGEVSVDGGNLAWAEYVLRENDGQFAEVIYLRHEGVRLPTRIAASREGRIRVGSNCASELEVGYRHADGSWLWQPLIRSRAEAGRQLELIVRDHSGRVIPGASVALRYSGNQALTDVEGCVRLPYLPEEPIWIDHSRYWAKQVTANADQMQATLLRSTRTEVLEVASTPSLSRLEVEPLFSLGYPLQGEARQSHESRSQWLLPPLPEGDYRLWLTDQAGLRRDLQIRLDAQGPATLRVD